MHEGRSAAFFDVDGTLVSTNIVHQLLYVRRCLSEESLGGRLRHPFWCAGFACKCLRYLWLDRRSRSRMNAVFYRNYRGLEVDVARRLAERCVEELIEPNLYPGGVEEIREQSRTGSAIVLVTGSLDIYIDPLAERLARTTGSGPIEHLSARLLQLDGRFTGRLEGLPLGDAEKAERLREFALARGLDLLESHAYGDSRADLPMLEEVGYPHAVNPDPELARIAKERGWPCHRWKDS